MPKKDILFVLIILLTIILIIIVIWVFDERIKSMEDNAITFISENNFKGNISPPD